MYDALRAAKPATRPPIKPVTKIKMDGLFPIFSNSPILADNIPAFEELIVAANITQSKNTPIKPVINDTVGFWGSNKDTAKAIIAIVHHGKYKPAINDKTAIIIILKMKRILVYC